MSKTSIKDPPAGVTDDRTHASARRAALVTLTAGCLLLAGCGTTIPATSASPVVTRSATSGAGSTGPSTAVAAPSSTGRAPSAAATSTNTDVSTPPATAAVPVATRACDLVNQQEAAVALGADTGPGQDTPLGETASACTYLSGASSLQLSLTPTGGKAVYDREHAGIPAGTVGVTEVTGVGDGAFSQLSGSRAAINFDKGDALVVIGLTTAGAAPTQDQLTTLATAAAGRL